MQDKKEKIEQEKEKIRAQVRKTEIEKIHKNLHIQKDKKLSEKEFDEQEQEMMRKAALRPVEVHPNQWDSRSITKYKSKGYTYQQIVTTKYPKEENAREKQKKKK